MGREECILRNVLKYRYQVSLALCCASVIFHAGRTKSEIVSIPRIGGDSDGCLNGEKCGHLSENCCKTSHVFP